MHPAAKQIMEHYKILENDDDYPWAKWVGKRIKFTEIEANKFFIGIMLDQGQNADRAWLVAEHFVDCHFDENENLWKQILETNHATLQRIATKGYKRKSYALRYQSKNFHKWLRDAARKIIDDYDGDVRNVWNGIKMKDVSTIYDNFKEFNGIGDALAKMAQFTLVREYGVAGGIKNRSSMKAKPDILLRRVVYRSGIASDERPKTIVKAIDDLKIESQADFDAAAWVIGREFCNPNPKCAKCPIEKTCEKIGI